MSTSRQRVLKGKSIPVKMFLCTLVCMVVAVKLARAYKFEALLLVTCWLPLMVAAMTEAFRFWFQYLGALQQLAAITLCVIGVSYALAAIAVYFEGMVKMTEVRDSNSNNKRVAAEMLAAARAEQQGYKARQRARILTTKITSCRQCPSLFRNSDNNMVECSETHDALCTINNLEFDALPVPDSCTLELV